jgi:ketosteroid isomerase-like protein
VSEGNVELHRGVVEAFNARDIEAFIAYCDPEIEFHSTFAAVGGAVYHGHDGVRQWDQDFGGIWGEEIYAEPEAYFEVGDCTLAVNVLHGRGQQSGAEVELPAAQLCRWRNGLIVYHQGYAHVEDAFADLGVSEKTLAPISP